MAIIAGADASLETQAKIGDDAHPALLAAQNDISMHTSSAPGLTGAIVANNMCGGANDFQGSEVRFSDKMNVTLADVIRTSLELELSGVSCRWADMTPVETEPSHPGAEA